MAFIGFGRRGFGRFPVDAVRTLLTDLVAMVIGRGPEPSSALITQEPSISHRIVEGGPDPTSAVIKKL